MDWQRYSAALDGAEEREFLPFMHELIGCAFAVIQPLFLAHAAVRQKADASPVTAADRGAEEALRRRIEQRYPDHGVLGEELGERAGGRYRWVLDPVDGTRAFISNCFLFGTLIALERDDGAGYRPVLGCIAHAAAAVALIGQRERTMLYRADGSQRRARVREPRALGESTVLCTAPPESSEQGPDPALASILRAARLARTWGDCFGYFALATGGADAMLDSRLCYWDVAAVIPVVEGAGARVSAWRGGDPLEHLSLVASTEGLHEELLRRIKSAPNPSAAEVRYSNAPNSQ